MAEDNRTKLGTMNPPVGAAPTPAPAPAADLGGVSKTSYLPPQVDPMLGQVMAGRYHITKKLGEGGMGAVYLATHQLLEKQVALKVLHGEFARKPDLVERFMQEAKAASRIRHENVIDISDFGSTPEGMVFFAMELLKGHDLHEEVARARLAGELLPWSRSKRIFLQICAALQAAHALGIVHRDLKPENIYLVEFLGEPDFVKLLDFGIAKLTEVTEDGGPGRKLTKTGMLFGTPEYMSPEQARGEHVDHRVDVYAMGCILFQLVTGRVPFEAENFMGVLSLHLTEPPPSIPEEVFDRIGAPRGLAEVIDRALLKDRNQRYQTIEALANAVRIVCGDPLPSGQTGIHQAQRVQAPANTTTHRAVTPPPQTGPYPVPVPTTGAGQTAGSRQRTMWTGNLSVPAAEDEQRRGGSKLPWILVGVLVLGGGAAAAFALTRGGGEAKQPIAAVTPDASPAAAPPDAALAVPDAGAAVTPAEARVPIHLESEPSGAGVYINDSLLGTTPYDHPAVKGSTAIKYRFLLAGYEEGTASVTPDGNAPGAKVKLKKLAAGKRPPVIPAAKPPEVKLPDDKPPEIKPPDDKPPIKQKCLPDPNDPGECLPTMPSPAGS